MAEQGASRIQESMARIQQRWGEQALRPLRELSQVDAIPTGYPALDAALQIGGIPRGQLTTLSGIPTSGATTLTYRIIASAQGARDHTIYIDINGRFDPEYASLCGVELKRLLLLHPPDAHHGLAAAQDLLLNESLNVLVLDGVFPAEGLRPLLTPLHGSRCALLCLTSVSVSESAALELNCRRSDWIIHDREIVGFRTAVTIEKNKFAPEGGSALLDMFLEGA
jgi:RecA/RadA recombinase